jgi:hypothetical protein
MTQMVGHMRLSLERENELEHGGDDDGDFCEGYNLGSCHGCCRLRNRVLVLRNALAFWLMKISE